MKINFLLHKVPRRMGRVFYERFPEPLHLNILSIFVALFGNYKTKIAFDLVVRQQYAFGLLKTAELAREQGLKSVTVIEFGVAAGAGLVNICGIAEKITRLTGVEFQVAGFDSGKGMPPARDHRDHPEIFSEGSFPLIDRGALMRALPQNARLILGDIEETLPSFLAGLSASSPVGFVAVDVDYYSSAKECLNVFLGAAEHTCRARSSTWTTLDLRVRIRGPESFSLCGSSTRKMKCERSTYIQACDTNVSSSIRRGSIRSICCMYSIMSGAA